MSNANVLIVGSGQQYSTVAEAVAAATDGETIDIQAGTYVNDFATIGKSLVIQAVGGPVVEQSTEPSPNGKAIWDVGGIGVTDTISGIEFTGARVPDDNGAGIRTEGGTLTLTGDYFYANQEGLLAASDPNGILTVIDSEFSNNGFGDGLTHNLYVNQIATLTIDHSYFHDALVGHEIKSRALNTIVENSRVQDQNGTASYVIDLPNGGNALIQNNVLQKGLAADNPVMITTGEEGNLNPGSLTVTGNTIVNDLALHTPLGVRNDTSVVATVTDNQVYGLLPAQLVSGPADVSGNTFLTAEPTLDTAPLFPPLPCFLRGTRIATPKGEVAIENLRVGDLVLTAANALKPIVWIGQSRVDCHRHARPEDVTPVRVRAGAFALGVPARDLLLSPGHAVFAENVLIPVCRLVNGVSILREEAARQVTYYHLELPSHDVLLAEGLPVESYLDDHNRTAFDNGGAYRMLHPDYAPQSWDKACAPKRESGPEVARVKRCLRATLEEMGYRIIVGELEVWAADERLRPQLVTGQLFHFLLPVGTEQVRLHSTSGMPSALYDEADDRRRLGAQVALMLLDGEWIQLDSPMLAEGFYPSEHDTTGSWRWTNGDASLRLVPANEPRLLVLFVRDVMRRWTGPKKRSISCAA